MKLVVDKFVYGMPGLSLIPETDFEAAMLQRYWETAKLSKGKGPGNQSCNELSYQIKFQEPPKP